MESPNKVRKGFEIMTQEHFSGQIDFIFLLVGLSLVIIMVLYLLGFQIPGIILLIFGIAAMIIGFLKIISSIYPRY